MSTPSTSDGDKKDASSKKKKKLKDKPTAGQEGSKLAPVNELEEDLEEEDSKSQKGMKSGEDVVEDEDQDSEEAVLLFLRDMKQSLSKEIGELSARVLDLEVQRNLNQDPAFRTPSKKKSKRSTTLLESVAQSTRKMDWRTMDKRAKHRIEDDDEDDDGSTPSDSSTSSDSSSSDDDDNDDDDDGDGNDDDNDEEKGDKENSSREEEKRSSGKSKRKREKKKRPSREKEKKNRKNDKPLGYLFKSIDASERQASKTIVSITRTEKECNVKIPKFSLGLVCKAMKTIMDFQEREGTLVNMSKVLSTSCKEHLRLMYNIQSTDLPTIGMSRLFAIIAQETKVYSKVQFYSELKTALGDVQLMEWQKVTPANHEEYYFQQLSLADEFMTLLRIMLEENKAYCPRVNDKENGLIRLFQSYHSRTYWKYMWCGMKQHYSTMQTFINEYLDKAMQHYQLSQALKEIPYSKGSTFSYKEKQYYDKRREIGKSLNPVGYSKSKDKPKYNSFNNINAEYSSGSDSEESVWRNANPVVRDNKRQIDEEQAVSNSEDSLSEASNEDEEVMDDDKKLDGILAAFANHKEVKADKKDYPCLRKIMSGKCEQEGCVYGHRRDVLLKGAQDMKAKLSAFISTQGDTNKDSSGPPYKVLQREKYTKH